MRVALLDIYRGIRCRYPLCCVLRFALGRWRGERSQAVARGIRFDDCGYYVPCGVFHLFDWRP